MTRAEALEILEHNWTCLKNYAYTDNELDEALEMAIKALEQEPFDKYIKEIDHLRKYISKLETQIVEQEPCEDAISRQAVLDMLKDINADTDGVGFYYEHYFDYIKNLPPVTSQPNKSSTENQNKSDIKQKCDRINSLASVLPYAPHREIQELLCEIMKLSSVSTEKTGRWEWNQYDYNPNLGNWHCSECRSVVIECVDKNKKSGIPLYKYCPQCGAKMEVEE